MSPMPGRRPLLRTEPSSLERTVRDIARRTRKIERAPTRQVFTATPVAVKPIPPLTVAAEVQTILSFGGTTAPGTFNNVDGFSPYTIFRGDSGADIGFFGVTKELGAWTNIPTLFSNLDTNDDQSVDSLSLLLNALALGDLMFIGVMSYKAGGNSTPDVTDDVGSTWEHAGTKVFSTDYRIDIFWAAANADAADPFTGANVTIDFSGVSQDGIIGLALNYSASATPATPIVGLGDGSYETTPSSTDLSVSFEASLSDWDHVWGLDGDIGGSLALALA